MPRDFTRHGSFHHGLLGFADEQVSVGTTHVGLGLVWRDFLEGRSDAVGIGLTWVDFSDAADVGGSGLEEQGELDIECFWRLTPTRWLRLQPDFQYIVNPGGDPAAKDAWILGFRAEFALL